MCALEDSISDLAAVDAPSRVLMTLGFAAYVIGGGTSAWPLRRVIGKPAVFALALNAALTLGVMLHAERSFTGHRHPARLLCGSRLFLPRTGRATGRSGA